MQDEMMQVMPQVIIEAMFVFMITMVLHGCRLEQILMEKAQEMRAVFRSRYLLMEKE